MLGQLVLLASNAVQPFQLFVMVVDPSQSQWSTALLITAMFSDASNAVLPAGTAPLVRDGVTATALLSSTRSLLFVLGSVPLSATAANASTCRAGGL